MIVTKLLHCSAIDRTTILVDNDINRISNTIKSLLSNKCTVLSTNIKALLPIQNPIEFKQTQQHQYTTHHYHKTIQSSQHHLHKLQGKYSI